MEALETLIPELRESEDERIRKGIIEIIKAVSGPDCDVYLDEKKQEKYIAWLEKQKEDKEELVYRMNGLMQEYVKAGKDDAEKDHRYKCYQLFWDALEDSEFFKQKEQKPEIEICPHSIKSKSYSMQKPAEWSEEDRNAIGAASVIVEGVGHQDLAKKLKSLCPQPKQEWSEEDKKMRNAIIVLLQNTSSVHPVFSSWKLIDWLKSLRPSWKFSEEQPVEYPTSTEMIAEWENNELPLLRDKDFRGDAERMAYNAFMDGFAKGLGYKK